MRVLLARARRRRYHQTFLAADFADKRRSKNLTTDKYGFHGFKELI
jgi:hypothetical protein